MENKKRERDSLIYYSIPVFLKLFFFLSISICLNCRIVEMDGLDLYEWFFFSLFFDIYLN